MSIVPYKEVLQFWFEEIDSQMHYTKDPDFDSLLRDRFQATRLAASRCELFAWRASPEGRLAEIIVLDQFSRNIYRDQPTAFASDQIALVLAQEMVLNKMDLEIDSSRRGFVYMPYMHSESLLVHDQAEALFAELGQPEFIEYEKKHKEIIRRFGRYPHRNQVLGRESTPAELAFLKEPGSSF